MVQPSVLYACGATPIDREGLFRWQGSGHRAACVFAVFEAEPLREVDAAYDARLVGPLRGEAGADRRRDV